MTSAAWEAMQMGIDPVCGPDGVPWEESSYKRPQSNIDIFGAHDDGDTYGKFDMDRHGSEGWDENDSNAEEDDFDITRQNAIIDWLSSSRLAIRLKTKEGFFIAKGPQVRLQDGVSRDLFEWLASEGIEDHRVIGSFCISHTSPDSKHGERLSFFKEVIEAPFNPLKKQTGIELDDDDIPFDKVDDDDIPF